MMCQSLYQSPTKQSGTDYVGTFITAEEPPFSCCPEPLRGSSVRSEGALTKQLISGMPTTLRLFCVDLVST